MLFDKLIAKRVAAAESEILKKHYAEVENMYNILVCDDEKDIVILEVLVEKNGSAYPFYGVYVDNKSKFPHKNNIKRDHSEMVVRFWFIYTREIEKGVIMHSDQGALYQSSSYQKNLADKGIVQSMSRKATCLDNAVIENFFGLLKSEMFYGKEFESIEHFTEELKEYIRYYNEDRIKMKLDGLSPVQYRLTKFAS